jgi:hypothetical protein
MESTTSHHHEQTHETNTTPSPITSNIKTKTKNGRQSNQTMNSIELLCSTILHAKHNQIGQKNNWPPKNHLRSSKKHPKHRNKITPQLVWIRCTFTQN